jgi:molecular chaperone GrpE
MNPFKWNKPESQGEQPTEPTDAAGAGQAAGGGQRQGDPDATAQLIDEQAAEVASLREQLAKVTAERDQAAAAWKQVSADYQNSQRRAAGNEKQAKEQGIRAVLSRILPVVDHFDFALALKPETTTAGQVIDGVKMIKAELLRSLESQGVTVIEPKAGDEFDPRLHEAIMHIPHQTVEAGRVIMTTRLGFMLEDRLVRPAQVGVAAAAPAGDTGGQG